VAAYFNLHYKVFSLKEGGKQGRVFTHAGVCAIADATFEVNIKGRERAIREGCRNVHAYVIGRLCNLGWDAYDRPALDKLLEQGYRRVTYSLDPDRPEFHLKDEDNYVPVFTASTVILADRVAFCSFSPALRSCPRVEFEIPVRNEVGLERML
jgi:hypothetical protein